ncbi:MAG: hypothetical protein RR404_00735 [Bacilli bacterium]
MKKYLLGLIMIIFFIFPFKIEAKEKVRLYLFYSDTCPHCAQEKELLKNLEKKYDYLEIYKYEVSNKEADSLIMKVFDKLEYKTSSVPFTVIGSQYFVGYNDSIGYKIEDAIRYYTNFKHKDVVGEILEIVPIFNGEENSSGSLNENIVLPFLGEINPKLVSLPIVAFILGIIDGFNPCAMWILLFLISVLIGMHDRKKMWILGSTFILTSAVVYLFFMLAWLNIALKMSEVAFLRLCIAIVALGAGAFNLRNYFKTSEAGCNVVDSKKRMKIFDKIKKFTMQKSFFISIVGIMGLAFMVNLIELACSAGLPLLFTQLLALNDLTPVMYGINIFIYIIFFLLDDLVVFIVAMITFKVVGISTKYTKYSHLIGGIIMLLISFLMVFKPEWLMFNF